LKLNQSVEGITMFKMNDIELVNYQCLSPIPAPMAV